MISNGCSRLHLLEVFCHEASELTKQVQLLGGRANRFGRAQGDLKTKEGRSVLLQMVWKQRPRHIWFSPTCGPWSAWNTFNEMRSIQLCEHVQRERERVTLVRTCTRSSLASHVTSARKPHALGAATKIHHVQDPTPARAVFIYSGSQFRHVSRRPVDMSRNEQTHTKGDGCKNDIARDVCLVAWPGVSSRS